MDSEWGMERARCIWEVQAGLIPGQPIGEYTRRWFMTSREYYELPRQEALDIFNSRRDEAYEYAKELMDPQRVNWVRVDWVYF